MKIYTFINWSILVLLFLTQGRLTAQYVPYEPFSFDNYTPVWKHFVVDSSVLVFENQDGVRHLGASFPILDHSALYALHVGGIKKPFEGGIIEKIDLATGNMIWRNIFDSRSQSKYVSQFPIHTRINPNGNIELLFSRQSKKSFSPLPTKGRFARTLLDSNTGDTLSLYYAPETEEYAVIPVFVYKPTTLAHNLKSDSVFEFVAYGLSRKYMHIFDISSLDFSGKLLNKTQVELTDSIPDKFSLHDLRIFRIAPDKYFYFSQFPDTPSPYKPDSIILRMGILDSLNNVHPFSISSRASTDDTYTYEVINSNSHSFILANWDYLSTTTINHKFRQYDYSGELLREFPDFATSRFEYNRKLYPYNLVYVEKTDDWMIFACENDPVKPNHFALAVYKLEKQTWKLLRRFTISPAKHYFSNITAYPLKDGDYLLNITDSKENKFDSTSIWKYWLRISEKDLVGTKTPAWISGGNTMLCYPNPAQSWTVVEFKQPFTGTLTIRDQTGKRWKSFQLKATKTKTLDIKGLPDGQYYISSNRSLIKPVKLIITRRE